MFPPADRKTGGVRLRTHPLVVTVTPNPSLDLLFETDRLVWDDANRMLDPRRRPGGQGINVSRAVRELGGTSVAIALLGGRTGEELERTLIHEDLPLRAVPAAGETRTFVAARERTTGRSLLLNARGPERAAADEHALTHAVADELRASRPRWLACCGSVPPGFEPDLYARLAASARQLGVRTVVDCDGVALERAADACDLLVPNEHEARRLLDQTYDDAVAAARALLRGGVHRAAITCGADGAVLATREGCWQARPPRFDHGSAVGAGDVFLAGLLVADDQGRTPPEALRYAVAAATAALRSRGADLVRSSDVDDILGQVKLSG